MQDWRRLRETVGVRASRQLRRPRQPKHVPLLAVPVPAHHREPVRLESTRRLVGRSGHRRVRLRRHVGPGGKEAAHPRLGAAATPQHGDARRLDRSARVEGAAVAEPALGPVRPGGGPPRDSVAEEPSRRAPDQEAALVVVLGPQKGTRGVGVGREMARGAGVPLVAISALVLRSYRRGCAPFR